MIEVARNEVSYIPYQWGHGNYYITPRWIVMNKNGAGYGRFAEATRNLDKINNEEEMLKHMKHCMWCNELLYIDCAYRDENGHIHFVDDILKNIFLPSSGKMRNLYMNITGINDYEEVQ